MKFVHKKELQIRLENTEKNIPEKKKKPQKLNVETPLSPLLPPSTYRVYFEEGRRNLIGEVERKNTGTLVWAER